MGFAGGDYNLVRYAGNNPVNRNDPGGEDVITSPSPQEIAWAAQQTALAARKRALEIAHQQAQNLIWQFGWAGLRDRQIEGDVNSAIRHFHAGPNGAQNHRILMSLGATYRAAAADLAVLHRRFNALGLQYYHQGPWDLGPYSMGDAPTSSYGFTTAINRAHMRLEFYHDMNHQGIIETPGPFVDLAMGDLVGEVGKAVVVKVGSDVIAPVARRVLGGVLGRAASAATDEGEAYTAKSLLKPVFERIGRIPPRWLPFRKPLTLPVRFSRLFLTATKTYATVDESPIMRMLEKFPGFDELEWQQGHVFIQQRWFRVGGPNAWYSTSEEDEAALLGMRRLGNAGWNLLPMPQKFNLWLFEHRYGSVAFGLIVPVVGGGAAWGSWRLGRTIRHEILNGK